MKTATVTSPCECQGRLSARLDEAGCVLSGAVGAPDGEYEPAPATSIATGSEQFQVGWLCPLCGRNTVRSFYRGALVYRADSDSNVAQ
jgi:hypothetical protein